MTRGLSQKTAALPPGTSRFSPTGIADIIEALRSARAPGPPTASGAIPRIPRAQQLVDWAQPVLDAAHGVHGDYKLLTNALDSAVPGTSRALKKYMRRGAGAVGELAEQHLPAAREGIENAIENLQQRLSPPKPPAPWYHDPVSAAGAGLGLASLAGMGALGAKKLLQPTERPPSEDYMDLNTATSKISAALDLIADELDAAPISPPEEKTAEVPDVLGGFYQFYKNQVGEEPPPALVEKLAQDADETTLDALKKLVKSASLERPTPLGEPIDGGGYRDAPSSRSDGAKQAWEQFEETLLNYDGA